MRTGAGIAGGADVILIPEIPYDVEKTAESILQRSRGGKAFSIVAISEGAMSNEDAEMKLKMRKQLKKAKKKGTPEDVAQIAATLKAFEEQQTQNTLHLSRQLEELTRLESRVTILGHLQRGGIPSAADRLLATRLGSKCAELIDQEVYGVMVAARGDEAVAVPLEEVAGNRKVVPVDHPWIQAARDVGTSLGD